VEASRKANTRNLRAANRELQGLRQSAARALLLPVLWERAMTTHNDLVTIKCADLISNTSSIVKHDPKFAEVYLEEKRLLLDVLTKADPWLVEIARKQSEVKL
jgi:hypothetical protein